MERRREGEREIKIYGKREIERMEEWEIVREG